MSSTRNLLGVAIAVASIACDQSEQARPPRAKVSYEVGAAAHHKSMDTGALLPKASYDAKIASPAELLGFEPGSRPARHPQIAAAFKRWAEQSDRMVVQPYGQTHEGRELLRAVISSPQNIGRLDAIAADIAKLADPRGLSPAAAAQLVDRVPAVAWVGYSIHGDELSGADAAVAVAHHLVAGEDDDIGQLLDHVVVVMDPVMNPDGRERHLSELAENAGKVQSFDLRSMHRGRWPWGRGNHYLFDLNRDWISGVHPETRGRWQQMQALPPQLVIDVHEMWPTDTYLFTPARQPINPFQPPHVEKWHKIFAARLAAAFDAQGWTYYTRDWLEGWYPGYTTEWTTFLGAVGILYEQAGIDGQDVRRPSGKILTYRQTVRAQALSSLTDLQTLAANRAAVLSDYLAARRRALAAPTGRSFALRPGQVPDRERQLLLTLLRQGIEVYKTQEAFSAHDAKGTLGRSESPQKFPIGTYLIPAAQPQGLLLQALLGFDPRMHQETLEQERRELERKNKTRIYDVTAWDLGHALDVDGWWITAPRVRQSAVTEIAAAPAEVVAPKQPDAPATAWLADGREDASVAFAAQAIELGARVHVSTKAVRSAGRDFARGSVLIRRQENEAGIDDKVAKAARQAGLRVFATGTSRSPDDGPDLGGHDFKLLSRPRVAVLANAPIYPTSYGHVWHQLDRVLEIPFSIVDVNGLKWHDLRRYNVIIVPRAWQPLTPLLKPHAKQLAAWVRSGGTLVGMSSSAADLTSKEFELGTVQLRRNVLLDLQGFTEAAERDLASRKIEVDAALVWGDKQPTEDKPEDDKKEAKPGSGEAAKKLAQDRDAWLRRFSPQGAFLRGLADLDSWITFGCRDELPVLFAGDYAFVAQRPATAPVRLAPADKLRLAGLLWPEARERLATTAYVTVEPIGAGQVILFAFEPGLRGQLAGTMRLLSNAVVYGPSLGATQPAPW